ELRVLDGGRVDRHLVGSGRQQVLDIGQVVDPTADGQRDEYFAGNALDQLEQRLTTTATGADVQQHQFVGALLIIQPGPIHRIAGGLDIDEFDALDHLPVLDVEAGDDALGEAHDRSASATSRHAAAKSSVPSYRARPMMAPVTPSSSAVSRARMSSRSVTPPEAMTGIDRLAASSRVASMFRPCIMPSRRMSVCTMAATPSCSNC